MLAGRMGRQWTALLRTHILQNYESRTFTCNVVGLANLRMKPFISLPKGETGSHESATIGGRSDQVAGMCHDSTDNEPVCKIRGFSIALSKSP